MKIHDDREDLSRFLVHLTRDHGEEDKAAANLISILKEKTIFAMNAHCLFMHKIKELAFSSTL